MVVIRLVCLGETGEGLDLEVSLEVQSRMRVNDVGPRFGGLKLVGGFYPAVVIGCGEEACLCLGSGGEPTQAAGAERLTGPFLPLKLVAWSLTP